MISQFFRNLPDVIKNLLIINVLMFLAKYLLLGNGISLDSMFSLYSFKSPLFEPYQILTHMFMHLNFPHLLFNMFALVMFGSVLEKIWGAKRFIIFYLTCGIGAAVLSSLVNYIEFLNIMETISTPELERAHELIVTNSYYGASVTHAEYDIINFYLSSALGASGAIFGIMVGFAVLFPNTELMLLFFPVPIKAKYFIPVLMVIELTFGLVQIQGDNIGHFAHLGGGIIGFILLKMWQKNRSNFY